MAQENQALHAHAVHEIIRQRRSVKPAQMQPDRPVARDVINLLLENANWAPTHGLTEPWRFRVFQGEGRQRLAAKLQELYQTLTPPAAYRPEKHSKLGKNPLLAPVVFAIGMEPDPAGKIPEIEEIAATACAVQNLHLTASVLGLAGYWSSPPVVYSDGMREFLQLGEGGKCLGLFYLGWPQPGLKLTSPRRPVADKVRWIDA